MSNISCKTSQVVPGKIIEELSSVKIKKRTNNNKKTYLFKKSWGLNKSGLVNICSQNYVNLQVVIYLFIYCI